MKSEEEEKRALGEQCERLQKMLAEQEARAKAADAALNNERAEYNRDLNAFLQTHNVVCVC